MRRSARHGDATDPVTLPSDWFQADIAASNLLLEAEVQTGTEGRNLYKASSDFRWHFQIGSSSFDADATVKLQYDGAQVIQPYTGSVDATIQFQLFGVGALFGVRYAIENVPATGQAKTSIALSWNDLIASYEKTGLAEKIIFTVGPGWSVGRLVTSMVQLIAPSAIRTLPPPWNLLDQISLVGLKVTFELDTDKVTVSWPINLQLYFMTLQSIDIIKTPGQEVQVQFVGKFVWGDPIPPYNAVTQNPQQVPGGGDSAFELRLLAIGQRVTIPGLDKIQTVGDAVDALRKFAEPAPDSKKVPVGTNPSAGKPIYAADSNILIGAHFLALSNCVEIKLIFNDPVLYGLRINLAGDKVGPFKGLQFEILYKKVTDTIGVYKLMLKLPDVMRYLQFGTVTVILPVVGVEIYTNGDFKIDFGFPYNLDFTRSFTLQIFPFTGSGGFYFAKLSAATATRVPKTTKGNFTPVIEFGFGMQVGLGKSLSLGILKAEISVTIFGIVEGVLAAWNPYPTGQLTDGGKGAQLPVVADVRSLAATDDQQYYYWIRGTIGILGKISGSVDFAIVKAEVALEVRAYVQVTFESYAAVIIYLEAGVTVRASIRINLGFFKITISFSFSATVRETFVIGSDRRSQAPWYDPGTKLFEARTVRPRLGRLQAAALIGSAPDFAPLATPAGGTTAIPAYFLAQPTVFSDTPEVAGSEAAAFVATTYLASPTGGTATAFDLLTRDLFLWVGSAFRGAGAKPTPAEEAKIVYSRPQLMAALDYLSDNSTRQSFTYDQVRTFIAALFVLDYKLPPESQNADDSGIPMTVFPMVPDLHLGATYKNQTLVDVDFAKYGKVDGAYLERLSASVDKLVAKFLDELEREQGAVIAPQLLKAQAIADQSLAQFIFVDYFVMLSRYLVQEAIDMLGVYAYPLTGGGGASSTRLSAIVDYINGLVPAIGGTVADNDLTYADVAEANRDHPMAPGKSFAIRGVSIQLKQPQSLQAIANLYKVSPDDIAVANAAAREVIAPARMLKIGGKDYPTDGNTTFDTLAAASGLGVGAVGAAIKDDAEALAPLALMLLPAVPYATTGGETLAGLATTYGVSPGSIAFDARDVDALFATDADAFLILPELNCLPAGAMLDDMAAHESVQHLSGMATRYLLHGLRLWTDGVSYPDAAPVAAGEDEAGLYRLMGQRVTVPSLAGYDDQQPLVMTLTNPGGAAWLNLGATGLPFSLPKEGADFLEQVLAKAKSPGLKAPVISVTEALAAKRREKTFGLAARIDLQAASAIALPNGTASADPGVPTLVIWTFADAMQAVVIGHQAAAMAAGAAPDAILPYLFAPKLSIQSIPNRPPQIADVDHYGFATLFDATIKRTAIAANDAASVPTYELIGTNQGGEALLESLLGTISATDTKAIQDIFILYQPNQAGDRGSGLQYDGEDHYKAFLIRTNLSTETNPPSLQKTLVRAEDAEAAPKTGILNDPYDFLSAVWQASITRSGGFTLSYQRTDGTGFPDAIFDQDGNATIAILILYAETGGAVSPAMNAVVTGDTIDSASTSVFAQSLRRPVSARSLAGTSLQAIADLYGIYVTDLAIAASGATLRQGGVHITDIVTQVQQNQTLDQVAANFGVSAAEIKRINPIPGIDWSNLATGTGLAIPDTTITLPSGTSATLASLASQYSSNIAAIGFANKDRADLFADGATATFDQVILEKQAEVPAGNSGLILTRSYPGDNSEDPSVFLEQNYGLLGYMPLANANFVPPEDALGLPAGPADDQDEEQLKALRRQSLVALNANQDDWTFKLIVPSSRLARSHAPLGAGTPDPLLNPYAGIGGFLQLELDWRDLYGNLISSPFDHPTAGYPLNATPLRVQYVDPVIGLSAWPSTEFDYLYDNPGSAGPVLEIGVRFNASRYDKTTMVDQPLADPVASGDLPAWQKNAMADRQVFADIFYQLNQTGPAPDNMASVQLAVTDSVKGGTDTVLADDDLAAFKAYVQAAWAYTDDVLAGKTPVAPPAIALSLSTAASFVGDIAKLAVALVVRRMPSQVAAEFRDYPDAAAATTNVPPRLTKAAANGGSDAEDAGYTLDAFTKAFESAFAGATSQLRLTTGEDGGQKGQPNPADAQLWAVRMAKGAAGAGAGFDYKLDGVPVFYAPAPLSTELISRPDPIGCYSYTRAGGLSAAPSNPLTFSGIDLDQWGRSLLVAIDRLLQPLYATPSFLVDWLGGTAYQEAILKAKYDLASAIASGVTNILSAPVMSPRSNPDAFADAREKMRQQLLIELGNAYSIDTIIQQKVAVSGSDAAGPDSPRLYGQPLATRPVQSRALDGAPPSINDSYSTSSFKFALGQGTSYLSYPFRAKSAADQRSFSLDIAYNPSEIEHQIASVHGIDGYKASSWLSFVTATPPLGDNDGDPVAVDVPVVLRAYPQPPSMKAQEAGRVNVDAEGATERLREAKGWNYDFSYDKQRAAQDRVHASVQLNIPKGVNLKTLVETVDLFVALARFTTVYPQIQQTFDAVLKNVRIDTDPQSQDFMDSALALSAFATLIDDIGSIWAAWVASHSQDGAALAARNSQVTFDFTIDETPGQAEPAPLEVTISYSDALPSGVASPILVFDGYTPQPPTDISTGGETALRYTYLDKDGKPLLYSEAEALPGRRARFAALDAIQYQNAWSKLQITRNDLLVDGNPTRGVFVYTTPWISFRDKLAPRLVTDMPIAVEQVPTDQPQTRTMAGHLQALFDAFFYDCAVDRQMVKFEAIYSYQPGAVATLPLVTIPILLVPAADYVIDKQVKGVAPRTASGQTFDLAGVAEAIKHWFKTNDVTRDGGQFGFSLTAFSALELNTQPLVQVPNLTLGVTYVIDL
jgi:LysM repeat protein